MARNEQTGQMVTTNQKLSAIAEFIRTDEFKRELEVAIPTALKKTLSAERAIRSAWQYITDPKHAEQMAKCTTRSVAKAIGEAVSHGLVIDGMSQQAYIVRFAKQAVFMVGYRGKIALMTRGPNIVTVTAHTVWEGDDCDIDFANNKGSHRKYNLLGNEKGKCLGYYAVATMHTGHQLYEPLSKEEAEKIRKNVAKRNHGDSPAYAEWEHEMAEKAAIHRLGKRVDLDPGAASVFFRDDLLVTREREDAVSVTADPNNIADVPGAGAGTLDNLMALSGGGGDADGAGGGGGGGSAGGAGKARDGAKNAPAGDGAKGAGTAVSGGAGSPGAGSAAGGPGARDGAEKGAKGEGGEGAAQEETGEVVTEEEAMDVVARLLWWTRTAGEEGVDLFSTYLFNIDEPEVAFADVQKWRLRSQIDHLEAVMVKLGARFPRLEKDCTEAFSGEENENN